jgi:hypothetical protein
MLTSSAGFNCLREKKVRSYVPDDVEQAREGGYLSYESDIIKARNGDKSSYDRMMANKQLFDGEGGENFSARSKFLKEKFPSFTLPQQ